MTNVLKGMMTAVMASCCVSSPAFSQVTNLDASVDLDASKTPSKSQVFTPDYFTRFAPLTASDMVARLPGFDIRGSSGGSRGFGQASLNILINGRRPSSKTSGANQILGRIPAKNVTQIEIIDAANLNIPGLSGQVANISVKTGQFSGNWEYALRFEEGSQPQLGDGEINISGKTGNLEAVASLDLRQFISTEDGRETFFDGVGNVTQNRTEKITTFNARPRANINLTLLRDNGHIANLNLSGQRQNRNQNFFESFEDLTDPLLSGNSIAENGTDRDSYEISGDYNLGAPLLGQNGELKLIALHRGENFDFQSRFLFDDGEPGETNSLFERSDREREYIGRAEYSWQTGQSADWTASFEGAFNTLDSQTDFTEDGVSDPTEFVSVNETRLQTNLSRNWALSGKTNIQASLGAEYSVISVDSDVTETSKFFRPKGLVNVSHELNESWSLRGQIERSVGQLDFDTFVSGVNPVEGTSTGGNSEIFPEQSWEAEFEIERRNPTGLSGRATFFYDLIEDPIDQLIFTNPDGTPLLDSDGDLIQGPGNLDTTAQEYGLRANLTWVLDDVLKGLRLTADTEITDSSIRDIVTDENRAVSRNTLLEYDIRARWDIDDTPYVIESRLEFEKRDDIFRIDEIRAEEFIRPKLQLALTHKDLFGMQWTARLQNILNYEFQRDRLIFDQTRNGDLIERELTNRQRGRRISIEVTDTF